MQDIKEIRLELIDKNIERWKENLLDLTKRNNMMNFKYNKKNVVKVNEQLDWLFESLINNEYELVVKNLDVDFDLDIDEENKDFEKVLTKLRQKRNAHMKEKGINVLYLSLGLLNWKETEYSSVFLHSPILMIPVELTRANKNSPFKLKIFDNQCIVNPTLQFKLKADFGIEMPAFEDDNIPSEYLQIFAEQISKLDGWKLINESYIGLFSFSKISLYHDLIRYKDRIKDHPVIGNVASGEDVYIG